MFKILGLTVLALSIAACGAPRPRVPPPHPGAESAPAAISAGRGSAYRVDAAQSELRVLVYRGGPLARLGHNHVMVNRALHGEVELARDLPDSSFTLVAPAAAFTVDDAETRHEEGSDFASVVPDEAKAGTFRNMMSAAVLDAVEFPEITVASIKMRDRAAAGESGGPPSGEAAKTLRGALLVTVAMKVKDRETTLEVPVTVLVDSGRVIATGAMELRQSALGLTPYSLMLGALQVEDAMMIKFRIVAVTG